jgi:TonB-dependent starch-binding outer membrane protein SusC
MIKKKTYKNVLMRKFLLTFALTISAFFLMGQSRTVTGKVTSPDGEPIIGANVTVENTDRGTITDADGKYSIAASKGESLVISFPGSIPQTIKIQNQTVLNLSLQSEDNLLNDVVVVGYGTSKKTDLTGSVSSINGEQLRSTITTNMDQALQGKVAGVLVTQNSGAPGGAASIRIRGANSLSLSNEPLYVIDGIPMGGDGQSTAGYSWKNGEDGQTRVNPLAAINPNDIVSIDVLKDASATAIYGSRGANGVILVTTKRGKKGESRISYNTFYGVQNLQRKMEMMNLQEFASYQNQIFSEAGSYQNPRYADPGLLGNGTDWQDEIFRTAGSYSHQLSILGGTDKTSYAITGGYFNQDGIVIGSKFDRITTRINLDNQVKSWMKVGGSLSFAKTKEKLTLNESNSGVIMQSLMMNPSISVRDINGNFAGPSNQFEASYNPVAAALQRNNTMDRQRLYSNFWGNITLMKGLDFRSEIGFDNNHSLNDAFEPTFEWGAIINKENALNHREENSFFWVNKNYLTYNKTFGKHGFTILGGQEAQKSSWNGSGQVAINLAGNDLQVLSNGTYRSAQPQAWKGASSLLSYYSRLNYNFNELLLATFTYRADASANFGPGKKWGYFPSGSLALRLSQMSFLKDSESINNLKLRLGYGESGNQSIPTGLFTSSLNAINTPYGLAYSPANIANPNLGWETTAQANIGIDLTVLKNRVDFTFDIYNKQTRDMLLQVILPSYASGVGPTQIGAPYVNIGKMENKGFDFSINTRAIQKGKFSWDSDVTFSRNRNQLTALDKADREYRRGLPEWYPGNFGAISRSSVGNPLGQFYGYVYEGIFTSKEEIEKHAKQTDAGVNRVSGTWLGDAKFKDVNEDGVIDLNDQTLIGDPNPDFNYGWNNKFKYGNLELGVFINGTQGGDIFNYTKVQLQGMSNIFTNQSKAVYDRAQFTYKNPLGSIDDINNVTLANPGTNIPRPTATDENGNNRPSSRYIEDGSYLRLQNVSLAFNVPTKLISKAKISRLKLYVNAQNMALWTNYSGYDPEIGAYNQSALYQGVDSGRYPTPKMMTFGLDVDF